MNGGKESMCCQRPKHSKSHEQIQQEKAAWVQVLTLIPGDYAGLLWVFNLTDFYSK